MKQKQFKSLDAIKRRSAPPPVNKVAHRQVASNPPPVKVRRAPIVTFAVVAPARKMSRRQAGFRLLYYRRYQVGVVAIIFLLLVGFISGIWATLNTQRSLAEDYEPATPPGQVKIYSSQELSALGPLQTVSNDVLFNLPLSLLQQYLDSQSQPTPQQQQETQEKVLAAKLKTYLKEKNSPFADYADVLAKQSHWKLLLAISFAESSFGKNCVDFNCSNIGVKPGHPYWHKYANYGEWMVDFNKLLDQRYGDWTLEQMNGVYVQPKNSNWLLATKQVLSELQERGIE